MSGEKQWSTWQCEYKECLNPNRDSRRCTKCMIKAYCSAECQKNDWPMHKHSCKEFPQQLVGWVEDIRKYIAIMRNDPEGILGVWNDVYDEYSKSTPRKRGAVTIDLCDHLDAPELGKIDTLIQDKKAYIWRYVSATDETFQKSKNEYQRLLQLLASYDPETEFVLLVFCSNSTTGKMCHIEEIIRVK
jgi:hypothetical protein